MTPEESAVAKSTGLQEENDMSKQDSALFRVLSSKKKISKNEANYIEVGRDDGIINERVCSKCKFNLGDEKKCHVVEGEIDNDHGISLLLTKRLWHVTWRYCVGFYKISITYNLLSLR